MSTILHLFCGNIAAGKSTLARRLADQSGALLMSQDDWINGLYGPEIKSFDDYVRCATRLHAVLAPHLVALLKAGNSVALDFPANTRKLCGWMREIAESADVGVLPHHLDLPDDACRARLQRRNADGSHPFAASEAEYDLVTRFFESPHEDEGLPILVHGGP